VKACRAMVPSLPRCEVERVHLRLGVRGGRGPQFQMSRCSLHRPSTRFHTTT
jgi:hypothetical protein